VDTERISADVLAAAAHVVEAFGRFDRAVYFDCFAPSASFIFYNADQPFTDRAMYEAAWDEWVAEGWRVRSCVSAQARVQVINESTAVFTHSVTTEVDGADGVTTLRERETIVFANGDDGWRAVHEHLSPAPA
jgi:ketosteroid isomerase-like protein